MQKAIRLHLDEAMKWIKDMAEALSLDRLEPGEASSMVGRLQFAGDGIKRGVCGACDFSQIV